MPELMRYAYTGTTLHSVLGIGAPTTFQNFGNMLLQRHASRLKKLKVSHDILALSLE